MSTASDQAPAAQGSLGLGADKKNECRELFRVGHSQRDLAERYEVTQTTIWRWCREVERAEPQSSELSVRQAAASAAELGFGGLTKETIEAAIRDKRLTARWGERSANFGRTGPKEHWIIRQQDLDAFLSSLEKCRATGCDRIGVTPEGYCSRRHASKVHMEAFDPEVSRRRAKEWWRTGEHRARILIEQAGGPARRRWKGRWGGSKPPAPGSRPRGHPRAVVTGEQRTEIERLAAQGWGRRSIATRLALSERAVRNVLDEL